jgi:hypothetical protein
MSVLFNGALEGKIGSGKSAKLSLRGSSIGWLSVEEILSGLTLGKVVNKADCGIDEAVMGCGYGLEGVFFVGESVGNDGGTGAVIETKPSFPRPDSETPDPRWAFVGDGLCVPAGGRFKI